MILQENRKIDKNRLHPAQNNWHKSHSRFYSSLFTKSPGTPVFIGITGGEEWSFTLQTLHNPSPEQRPDVQFFISGEQNIATPRAIFCPDQAQIETS